MSAQGPSFGSASPPCRHSTRSRDVSSATRAGRSALHALEVERLLGRAVEQMELVDGERQGDVLARLRLLLDGELRDEIDLPRMQMHELLVAEVLHDVDLRCDL